MPPIATILGRVLANDWAVMGGAPGVANLAIRKAESFTTLPLCPQGFGMTRTVCAWRKMLPGEVLPGRLL